MNLEYSQSSEEKDEEIVCPFAHDQHRLIGSFLIGFMFIIPVIIVLFWLFSTK